MRQNCSQVVIENFFEPCILFLLLKKPGYGYALMKELNEKCGCRVNVGNLYRGLDRMVKSGYVMKKRGESELGPARVIYEITGKGKTYLAQWIESLEEQKKTISKLINNYRKTI